MGIPAIPKFSIPNLCGASPEMDDMLKKKDELMKELEASLEIDASALKEKIELEVEKITSSSLKTTLDEEKKSVSKKSLELTIFRDQNI